MNERMIKKCIIPAGVSSLCVLLLLFPWFKLDALIYIFRASPWSVGRILNVVADFGVRGVRGIGVIVVLFTIFATLLTLFDVLAALCEFLHLDLNKRFPIINNIAVLGYGLEILLAIIVMIVVGVVNAKGGGGLVRITAWPVFALLFAGGGIAMRFMDQILAGKGFTYKGKRK